MLLYLTETWLDFNNKERMTTQPSQQWDVDDAEERCCSLILADLSVCNLRSL